ncbi:MAG: hypothetical protein R3265_01190 [Hyphomonas sp.]|nr:hypothetical protein [Hyphomonas sp.]
MRTIRPLISHHRAELKAEARLNRYLLLGATFMALLSFATFILTLLGHYPLPLGRDLFADNPERMIGASNFFVATAIGAALRMWRKRQMRIKLLIAEAFIREDDADTGLRLLLEPVFGVSVWDEADQPILGTGRPA